MIRDMYLKNQTEESIKSRIVEEVDTDALPPDHRLHAGGPGAKGAEPLGDHRQVGRSAESAGSCPR